MANPHAFHRGPLPDAAIVSSLRAVLVASVDARVNVLLVNRPALVPGATMTIIGARMPANTTRAEAVFVGPGYLGIHALAVGNRIAGAQISLPKKMAPGRWTLAIVGYADVEVQGRGLAGVADVRLAIYRIRGKARHRHGRR